MDWSVVITGITVIGFVYGFLRNFKTDINHRLESMEKRMDNMDERIFQLATGKSLKDAILEEKIRMEKK